MKNGLVLLVLLSVSAQATNCEPKEEDSWWRKVYHNTVFPEWEKSGVVSGKSYEFHCEFEGNSAEKLGLISDVLSRRDIELAGIGSYEDSPGFWMEMTGLMEFEQEEFIKFSRFTRRLATSLDVEFLGCSPKL
ncbi:hypothetical protein HBA55_28995 [Pseudomaricurvus alkylphenolicus]|uniref:hypothetical protein n=1 Tax=Pseudomaricurvus alkylphenolicus TaxID=1306991 RepID=UPI00142389B9|nr:hypothetical protein [Pseudomaricurvus alkylphenolicus]NIB43681.1 hypothetical protein [Pseudomaricurvus alkylphenolicus]